MLLTLWALSAGLAAPEATPDPTAAALRDECARLGREAEQSGALAVAGRDGWLFLGADLRYVGANKFWGEAASSASTDPLPAILDFKAQLDRAGIELILLPVPPKPLIYIDKINAAVVPSPRLDEVHAAFIAQLRQSGVRVADMIPDMRSRLHDGAGDLFCRTDSHWSGRSCILAARAIAKEIKSRPWLASVRRVKTQSHYKRVSIRGDLGRSLQPPAPAESLPLRFVSAAGKPVEPSRASPVLLMGDSHNLVFHAGGDMLARGAGLPDQLASELGFAVDLLAVRGSGATPARVSLLRRARADSKYLQGKKLVVWCFAAREFAQSEWRRVPVVR